MGLVNKIIQEVIVMVKSKYKIGDRVIINGKDWIVDEIRMRFGKTWTYGLVHETKDGKMENLAMETGSLEKLMK